MGRRGCPWGPPGPAREGFVEPAGVPRVSLFRVKIPGGSEVEIALGKVRQGSAYPLCSARKRRHLLPSLVYVISNFEAHKVEVASGPPRLGEHQTCAAGRSTERLNCPSEGLLTRWSGRCCDSSARSWSCSPSNRQGEMPKGQDRDRRCSRHQRRRAVAPGSPGRRRAHRSRCLVRDVGPRPRTCVATYASTVRAGPGTSSVF